MNAATGPAAKTERLLNLVLVLLYTRRPLAKAQIRGLVPQYGETASTEAFDRMFERDKDELRALGVPLVTEEIDVLHEDEPGYRIHQRDYALPDIEFEPDELAVLGLASRSWAHASMAGPAAQALRKLRASDVERDEGALIGIEPRLRTTEPAFEAVKDAVLSRTPITFGYRRPERARGPGPHRPAVVARAVARPLVPRGPRSRPRRHPRVPPLAHRRLGAHGRQAGIVRRPRRPRGRGSSSSAPLLAARRARPGVLVRPGAGTACADGPSPTPRPTAAGPT